MICKQTMHYKKWLNNNNNKAMFFMSIQNKAVDFKTFSIDF